MTESEAEYDTDYYDWMEEMAKECTCCPYCCGRPCDSVLAGGLCDEECHCDEDTEWF